MDRQIVYPGSIPLDTDLLLVQRHVMAALGALARVVLGPAPVADGLACVPAASGYGVVIGPGSLTALGVVDGTPYGSLGADPTPLVQMAVNTDFVTLPLSGPPDGDHALCWLIQASLSPRDAGPVALPVLERGGSCGPVERAGERRAGAEHAAAVAGGVAGQGRRAASARRPAAAGG